MTYEEFSAKLVALDAAAKEHSATLNAFPKGPMGLTPDHIKETPEWHNAYAGYHSAVRSAQNLRKVFPSLHKAELIESRNAIMAKRQAIQAAAG